VTDPVFLDIEDVLLIHEEQLPRYGGSQEFATELQNLSTPR
jgi:hypothetical protein